MEMTKHKETAKHFSLLINGISMGGDTCRQWEEQGRLSPLTFCRLLFLHQAVMLCCLLDHSLWKCACIRSILNAAACLPASPGPGSAAPCPLLAAPPERMLGAGERGWGHAADVHRLLHHP